MRWWFYNQRLNIQHSSLYSSTFVFLNNSSSSSCLHLCSLLCASFSLDIHRSFSITFFALILLWIPKLKKFTQLLTINVNHFQRLPYFFMSLNISLVTFIFSFSHYLLINTWSSKLIRPIITSLCVFYITTWKHLASSLWVNISNFIFWLFHICNDTPPNSSKDSNVNMKVKTMKEGVGICSLTHNILGVEGHARASRWGLGRLTSGSIIQTNLHKLNNKLVNA